MSNRVLVLVRGGAIAAIYVVLVIVLAPISFSFGQIRVAEALTILPFLMPEAIPGLFIGCLTSSLLAGAPLIDIVIGSISTLLAAFLTSRIKIPWLAPLPPIVVNAFGVGYVLYAAYNVHPYWLAVGSVAIGQAIACYALGYPLLLILRKYVFKVYN